MGWKPLGRGGSPRGPRRFAPWAATWRRGTREIIGGHTEAHTGSKTASGIRSGALNGRAGVEAK